ncbi:MAG: Hpt domain-containing protein [Clostridia bacterium]|nr:Hpt domain-containing protein [Clostridia bacterium]
MASGKNPPLPGVDTDAGLRFAGMDAELYRAFLRQFPQDDSVLRLHDALERGDVADAFSCAHTLKGLSAQLGITRLAELAAEICDLLRAQKPEALPAARARFIVLRRHHAQIVRALGRL